MRVMVTGANGFVGKNLCLRLRELGGITILPVTRDTSPEDLNRLVGNADFVFHLAGVNRPQDPAEFQTGNAKTTQALCAALLATKRKIPVVYTSSSQADLDNPYGQSKLAAEKILTQYSDSCGAPVYIYRLPNIFGKWCRPNYNSAVATFCHNITRGLPIQINNPSADVRLVYIDDVLDAFLPLLKSQELGGAKEVKPVYSITVGELAAQIEAFRHSRDTLVSERVGTGFVRALYSTYVSYLPTDAFSYKVPAHKDPRGVFVEMLKTPDTGQFSFFTAHPGITRGEHYHHTKTEKFLVIKGKAHFGFRHMDTNEYYEIITAGEIPQIVETVPGWTHNITNIGADEMIVMLWANEIFDRQKPDTIAQKVKP
ncbi:MAG: capsular polysaccharide biosynthesis protein CapF [Burkholderiales bacterium]